MVVDECIEIDNPDFTGSLYEITTDEYISPDIPAYGLKERVTFRDRVPIYDENRNFIGYEDRVSYKYRGLTRADKGLYNIDNTNFARYNIVYHGTHIAGIAAAKHNNKGVAGIDAKAFIIPVNRAIGRFTLLDYIKDELLPTLKIKTGNDKVRLIVNMSYGLIHTLATARDKNDSAYLNEVAKFKELSDMGVIFIHSAGNNWTDFGDGYYGESKDKVFDDISYTISVDNYLNIAAHGFGRIMRNSGYSSAGDKAVVQIPAPGVNILSAGGRRHLDPVGTFEKWFVMSGTSMAAPMVAGSAALLWRLFPEATGAQIVQLLEKGAKASNAQQTTGPRSNVKGAIGDYVGCGFLDVAKSVQESKNVAGLTAKSIVIPVKQIVVASNKNTLNAGDTAAMSVSSIAPYTADNKTYSWVSSNPSVLTVSANGTVQAASTVSSRTTVDVYARANDAAKTESNRITFTVNASQAPVTTLASVSINSSVTPVSDTVSIMTGESVTLTPQVNPSGVTCSLNWTVGNNNSGVVTQTLSGTGITLRGNVPGTVRVTVTATANSVTKTDTIDVKVSAPDPGTTISSVKIGGTSDNKIKVGAALTLSAVINPNDANCQEYSWNVADNNGIVAESRNGRTITITGLAEGTVAVTFTAVDMAGNIKSDTVNVTVEKADTPVTPPVTPGDGGSGGGGGCNAGFAGILALLVCMPVAVRRRK